MFRSTLTAIGRVPEARLALASGRSLSSVSKEIRFPNDDDHATGEERLVRLAIKKGIKDPFDLAEQVRGPGTKDNPNIIHTLSGSRMVGCKCEEDSSAIKWMWIHLNESKRCECGFWFKAVPGRRFWEEVDK